MVRICRPGQCGPFGPLFHFQRHIHLIYTVLLYNAKPKCYKVFVATYNRNKIDGIETCPLYKINKLDPPPPPPGYTQAAGSAGPKVLFQQIFQERRNVVNSLCGCRECVNSLFSLNCTLQWLTRFWQGSVKLSVIDPKILGCPKLCIERLRCNFLYILSSSCSIS